MEYLILFLLGAVIGSFLNVCIYRLPRHISLVRPGSFCPDCGVHIPFYHKIPVLSYLFLRGQCHSCGKSISFQYFAVELLSSVLTVLSYSKFGPSAAFVFYTVFIYFLIVISFIDLSTQLIHNRILLYLLSFGVFFNLLFYVKTWESVLLGFFAGGASLLFFALLGQVLFRKESMGMGDIKFAAVLGFFMGWKMVLLALFVGFIYAFLTMIVLSAARRHRIAGYVPMAPFLTIGTLTFIYWGPALIQWYWNLFQPM